MSADLSTLFDVGGIVGAIAAGVISDYSGMSALTCAAMFGLAFPTVSTIFFLIYSGNRFLVTLPIQFMLIIFI